MTISEYISLAYGERFGNPIPEDIRAILESKTAEVVQLSDGGYIGIEKPRIIDYDPEYITAFD